MRVRVNSHPRDALIRMISLICGMQRVQELRKDAMRSKTDKMRGKMEGKRWEAGVRGEISTLWMVSP
jgi:hypothetical protein